MIKRAVSSNTISSEKRVLLEVVLIQQLSQIALSFDELSQINSTFRVSKMYRNHLFISKEIYFGSYILRIIWQ